MTGIREMFSEYAEHERDWFQLQFAFEQTHNREKQRELNRKHDPKRMAYKSVWITAYQKRKRLTDPEWAARRRKQQVESERRRRAAQRAA